MPAKFNEGQDTTLSLALNGRTLEARIATADAAATSWMTKRFGTGRGAANAAHLRIDASALPAEVVITITLDGETLFQGNRENAADAALLLAIPPGTHVFQAYFGKGASHAPASRPLSVEIQGGEKHKLKVGFEGQTIQVGPNKEPRRVVSMRPQLTLE